MTNIKLTILRAIILFAPCCFAQPCLGQIGETLATPKNSDAKMHWERAMIYKEEVKTASDNQFVIDELEALVAIEDFPDAYLELGKLYGMGYTLSVIERSNECFDKYMELLSSKRHIAENEKNRYEVRRNLRTKKFQDKLKGKWTCDNTFGEYYYSFEVNSDGTVTVPSRYSSEMDQVTGWQTLQFLYWPQFSYYTINAENTKFGDTFPVKTWYAEVYRDMNVYIYIAFYYDEENVRIGDDKLVCYVNMAMPSYNGNHRWTRDENRKYIFRKVE